MFNAQLHVCWPPRTRHDKHFLRPYSLLYIFFISTAIKTLDSHTEVNLHKENMWAAPVGKLSWIN